MNTQLNHYKLNPGHKFYEAMTDEEKAKLYKAIGYEEAGAVSRLPKEVSHVAAQTLSPQ